MPTMHTFEGTLSWRSGGPGAETGNHRLTLSGGTAIEVSAAPQYKGDPTKTNPEELFLASLASCQMLTYLALARRKGLELVAYEDRPTATLTMKDRRMRITEVVLRPRITLGTGADAEAARALADAAHEGCFVANSVACEVRLEPEIVGA
jgi:organic hydroperoxide reductase OsmC/OhrA